MGHQVGVVVRALLDDIAVVVNVLALLAHDEAVIELGQDLVSGKEFDRRAHARGREDLWHQVVSHLLGLRGEHTEGKLAQLRCRLV